MGLFGFGKKKQPPLDEGERLYRQALSAGGMRQKLEYLEQSAALGNRHAKAALARCYWENFSNEAEKIQKAAALLDEAAAAGALLDSGLAGRIYDKAGRKEEAARHYRAAAEQGDSWAQFKTGWNYAQGTFLEQDYEKAAYWYEKASEQGYAAASNNLAVLYGNGRGVPQDYETARTLMEKAAAQGSQVARGNLAWDYYHGEAPCPQDDEKAAAHAQAGMDSKDDTCRRRCRYVRAMLAGQNRGGVRDRWDNAVYALRRLADEGFAPAKEGLELLNRQEEARTTGLYRKALESGDMEMMDQAARNGCFDAELYLLKDAAKRLGEGETFGEREITKCMVWYRLTWERGQVPREVLWPILDALGEVGYQLLSENKPKDAFYLVKDTDGLDHALCQYVLAHAFYLHTASRDFSETDRSIAYCRAFRNNPQAQLLKNYKKMCETIDRDLFFLQLNRVAVKGKEG